MPNSILSTNNNSVNLSDLAKSAGTSYPSSLVLDMCSLPSTQGWTYSALGNSKTEGEIFSIQSTSEGCALHQNSIGAGFADQGYNGYQLTNVVDQNMPFILKIRARITQEELSRPDYDNHFGFCFTVDTGKEAFSIGLGPSTITAAETVNDQPANIVLSSVIDNTKYHDYRLEGTPGVGYKLYVDNNLVGSGFSRAETYGNRLYFGDGTGGCNAAADVASFEYISNGQILNMCSLPSTQGWTYSVLGNSKTEGEIFSILSSGPDCVLHQDSMDAGTASQGCNEYILDNVVDPTKPFVVTVKAKVLDESPTVSAGPNHFGFGFYINTPKEAFGIGLGTTAIQDINNDVIVESTDNRAQFREYRLECTPGVGYKFYIDGSYICSGKPRNTSTIGFYGNRIYLGDCTGGTNAIAEVKSFEFEQGAANNPPNTPSIPSGPTTGATGTPYAYSTSATDPDGDQVKYTFDWGDGTTSETAMVNSGTEASASQIWSTAGTYNIKAKATDINGASSDWSGVATIIVAQTPAVGIEVTKTANPASVSPGDFVDFKISVTNTGNVLLKHVKVIDTLPVGMTYMSSSPASSTNGKIITWDDIGQLSPGSSREIKTRINIDSDARGKLINIANIEASVENSDQKTSKTATSEVEVQSSQDRDHYVKTQHFLIRYRTTGEYPVDPIDIYPSNNIPDYIDKCAFYLEQAYDFFVIDNDFEKGVTDPNIIPEEYPDCRSKYYVEITINEKPLQKYLNIKNIKGQTYGTTLLNRAYTKMNIANNLLDNDLRDTCFHEYYHAIQSAYYPYMFLDQPDYITVNPFIIEGPAKLMGDTGEFYPDNCHWIDSDNLKNYFNNKEDFFGGASENLAAWGLLEGYNSELFWHFITYNSNLLINREILNQARDRGWYNYETLINQAFAKYSQFNSLDSAFTKYAKANLFPEKYYPTVGHSLDYPSTAQQIRQYQSKFIKNIDLNREKEIKETIALENYGISYFKIKAPDKNVRARFSGYIMNDIGESPASIFVMRYSKGIDRSDNEKIFGSTSEEIYDTLSNEDADNTIYVVGRLGEGYGYAFVDLDFIKDETPQTVTGQAQTITPSGTSTTTTGIDPSAKEAKFVITWPGSTLNLSLESPSSELIDYTTVDPNITHVKIATLEYYAVKNPEPGNWTMIINAINVPIEGENFTATAYVKSNLTLSLSTDSYRYNPSQPITLTANLSNNGTGFTGAIVKAEITRPVGKDNIILHDDGTHGDAQANDGIYSNVYTNTSDSGTYHIKATAKGILNGYTFAREDQSEVLVQLVPDLIVSNIDFSKNAPSSGDPMFINATVKNIGDANATGFAAKFIDISPQKNVTEIGSNVTLSNIIKGQSLDISLPWIAKSGQHDIYVNITSLNLEKNESNNTAHKLLYFTPVYNLSIIEAGTDKLDYQPGDNVTLYCIVENADRDLFSPDKVYAEINGTKVNLTNYSTGIFIGASNNTEKPGRYYISFWANETGYVNDSYGTYFDVLTNYPKPNIKVTKTSSPVSGAPSTNINFTINVTNIGDINLTAVKVIDQLPSGLSYVASGTSPAPDSAISNSNGTTITWNNLGSLSSGYLDEGNSASISLTCRIDIDASGTLENNAEAFGVAKLANDSEINVSGSANASIYVRGNNQPPIANAGGPYHGKEGCPITFDASRSYSPNGSALKYRWDFNNDGKWDTEWSDRPIAIYAYGRVWTGEAILKVKDGNICNCTSATVSIENEDPYVFFDPIIQPHPDYILPFDKVKFAASFTDQGWLENHTATWDFGDNSSEAGNLAEISEFPYSKGTSEADHAYSAPGEYTVTFTVKDCYGDAGTAYKKIKVITPAEGQMIQAPGGSDIFSQDV